MKLDLLPEAIEDANDNSEKDSKKTASKIAAAFVNTAKK